MKNTKLITPVINLNGNTGEDLIQKLRLVMDRLREVEQAMAEANDVCHGRNFQHLITDRFDRTRHVLAVGEAQQAWGERRQAIEKIREEVFDLSLAIYEQVRAKKEKLA